MNEQLYLEISRYSQPILILFGTIGALLNQLIFHQRKLLRRASCSLYFRLISINDLAVLYLIVFTQWLNDQFHIDPTIHNRWYCKFRTYATFSLYALSPYGIVLVCIDRFCRTSKYHRIRRIATLKFAHRMIVIIIGLILCIYIHIPFQYTIIANQCLPLTWQYYRFLGYFLLIFYCLCPPICMSIFSSWTFIHLRQQKRQSNRRILLPRKRRYHRDYQLMKILFLYVLTNIICTLPFASTFLLHVSYHNSNPQLLLWIKSSILLCNCNHATSFYIYTLATPIYRRELFHLFTSIRMNMIDRCKLSSLSTR